MVCAIAVLDNTYMFLAENSICEQKVRHRMVSPVAFDHEIESAAIGPIRSWGANATTLITRHFLNNTFSRRLQMIEIVK